MIKTTDHFVAASLKEFLNYKCLTDLRAFTTVTGQLTQYTDPKWSQKTALGSSYQTWVYDSGIPGAIVPTSLSGVTGATPDFRNGRFLAPTGTVATGRSAAFSVNEINFYISSSPESKLIFETKYLQNPDRKAATGYLAPYSTVAPCVFVKSFQTDSEEQSFGGEVESTWNFKIIAMAKTESQLLGIQKVVRDSRQEIFPLITGSILDQYNNLSVAGWTYQSELDEMDDYCFVSDSTFKIQELDVFTSENPKMFVGIGNIEVCYYHNPR